MINNFNKIKGLILQLKGLTAIGISDISSSVISSIFWLYIASTIGAENYGTLSYFLAIAGMASTVSSLGSQTTLTVYSAKNVRIESSIYLITIISGIMMSIVLFFLFYSVGLSTYAFGSIIFGLVNGELLGRKLYKNYSKYILTQKILMVGLGIGLYHFIGINGIILGIGLSFFSYSFRIYTGFKNSKIDFRLLKSRVGFMFNNYILELSSTLASSLSKLIIAPILGFVLLGNYQLGLQLFSTLFILPSIIYKYTLTHDASGNSTKKIKIATIIASAGITVLGVFLSPIIIPHLFPKYAQVIDIIQILSFAMVPATISLLYDSQFLGSEKTRIVLFGAGIHLLVLIVGIVLLSNYFSVKGVAIAFVLATVVHAIFYLILSKTNPNVSIR